jgi:hypothetical protein
MPLGEAALHVGHFIFIVCHVAGQWVNAAPLVVPAKWPAGRWFGWAGRAPSRGPDEQWARPRLAPHRLPYHSLLADLLSLE